MKEVLVFISVVLCIVFYLAVFTDMDLKKEIVDIGKNVKDITHEIMEYDPLSKEESQK